jgi:hypothetical protein
MKLRAGDALWMGTGFGAAFVTAAAILVIRGANERGIVLALMFTARVAFLAFWPAYSAGALASLFGPPFDRLRRKAREFGLAFAAALAVHVGLVGLLCALATPPALGVFIFFGGAAIFAYALALFSFEPMRSALGPERWRLLSAVGMNYIAYAFIADFVGLLSFHSLKAELFYAPFALLALAAPSLRLAASLARLGRHRLEPHQRQT